MIFITSGLASSISAFVSDTAGAFLQVSVSMIFVALSSKTVRDSFVMLWN